MVAAIWSVQGLRKNISLHLSYSEGLIALSRMSTHVCLCAQVPTASQTVLSPPQPSPPTDIERFLSLTTPTLPSKGVAQPQLVCARSFQSSDFFMESIVDSTMPVQTPVLCYAVKDRDGKCN